VLTKLYVWFLDISAFAFDVDMLIQTEELSKTRESLIRAETSKKHLEEKIDGLSRRLHGNEEKLAVYERRTSTVNGIPQPAISGDMSREEQLEAEVAELRCVRYYPMFNAC